MFGSVVKFGKITNLMIWSKIVFRFVQSKGKERKMKECTKDFYIDSPQSWARPSLHP